MANITRVVRFISAETLKKILQAQSDDDNSSIDRDTSESHNDDHMITDFGIP